MKLIWIFYLILFLVPVFEFLIGGRTLISTRNLQYVIAGFSIVMLMLSIRKKQSLSLYAPSRNLAIAISVAVLLAYLCDALSRYFGVQVSGVDFSVFDGMLQQGLIGHWGYEPMTQVYHFGVHPNWILLAVFPFYALFQSPVFLIILGAILIWVSGLLVVKLAKALGHDDFTAWIAGICWWTASFTISILHGVFYPEMFYPVFLFGMLIAQVQKTTQMFWLYALLFLSVKEDASLYLIGFGGFLIFSYFYPYLNPNPISQALYSVLKRMALFIASCLPKKWVYHVSPAVVSIFVRYELERKWTRPSLEERKNDLKKGLLLILVCLCVLFVQFKITKPYFLGKSQIDQSGYVTAWWGQWGNSSGEIVKNILFHPLVAIKTVLSSSGYKSLYIPLLFIPLFSLDVLFASLPIILIYGVAVGHPQEYGNYYAIVLWGLALYGLLQNRLLPRAFILILLLSFPLWNGHWIQVTKMNLQNWSNLMSFKSQMSSSNSYCLHESMWPYLSSNKIKLLPFSHYKSESCFAVFSLDSNFYPQDKQFYQNLYFHALNEKCVEHQIGSVIELKDSAHCHQIAEKIGF